MRLEAPPESRNAPVNSHLSKTSAFLHPDFASVMQKWQRKVQSRHGAPQSLPSSGTVLGSPSWLEAWAEAGDRLSRMRSVIQSPSSLLHTQTSPTCWFAFDKGGSLSPAAFLPARLEGSPSSLQASVPPLALQDFQQHKLHPPTPHPQYLNFTVAPAYPCVSAGWVNRDGSSPPLHASWAMPCWGTTSPAPAALL